MFHPQRKPFLPAFLFRLSHAIVGSNSAIAPAACRAYQVVGSWLACAVPGCHGLEFVEKDTCSLECRCEEGSAMSEDIN